LYVPHGIYFDNDLLFRLIDCAHFIRWFCHS